MPRKDPFRNFNFVVQVGDDITQAGFSDCTGLGATTEPLELNEGGVNEFTHKLAGRTKPGNITLKWGMTDSRALYEWYRGVTRGEIVRRHVTILVFDLQGIQVDQWELNCAWPTKWEGPAFSAKSNEVAIETLELAHHGWDGTSLNH
jgi:phage tail-like protein